MAREREREAEETCKRKQINEVSKREEDVRTVLGIVEGGVATGFDAMKDFNILEMIHKSNYTAI